MQINARLEGFGMTLGQYERRDLIFRMPLAEQSPMFGLTVGQGRTFYHRAQPGDKPFPIFDGRSLRNGLSCGQDERIMHDFETLNMYRTTHFPNNPQHRFDGLVILGFRQPELCNDRRNGVRLFLRGYNGFIGRWGVRRRAGHTMVGSQRSGMPKKSFAMFFFFVVVVSSVVLPPRTTLAHDAPTPTQLDFDASQAPNACNDDALFRALITNWVPAEVLVPETDRQLVVRIRRSPTGGKLAEVTLLDSAGAPLKKYTESYFAKTECHRVLYETARAAAKLLGAFDKPPPPEPCPTCPACPPPPVPAKPEPCPACPALVLPLPRPTLLSPTRRGFFAAGVSLGTGITPQGAIGPYGGFGFVLSPHLPRIQFEMAGGWAPQTLPISNTANVLRVHMVPLVGSLCYARYVFRLCSGLATTFYTAERSSLVPGYDEMRMTLAVNVQIGTEFEIGGPFSIRVDIFGRLRFMQRTYGYELANLDALNPFTASMVAMGVWSFD